MKKHILRWIESLRYLSITIPFFTFSLLKPSFAQEPQTNKIINPEKNLITAVNELTEGTFQSDLANLDQLYSTKDQSEWEKIRVVQEAKPVLEKQPLEVLQVLSALPMNINQIEKYGNDAFILFKIRLDEFLNISSLDRNFDNTIRVWDWLYAEVNEKIDMLEALGQIYTSESLRDKAREIRGWLNAQVIDALVAHPEIYSACKEVKDREWNDLTDEHQYYLTELMLIFRQMGMHLEEYLRNDFAQIKKDIHALECEFNINIEEDKSVLVVAKEDLKGIDQGRVNALERIQDERFVLKCDLPTYDTVISQCSNQKTRQKVHELWFNCASKKNERVAKSLIELRKKMAVLLGFQSYADYELSTLMLSSSSEVLSFLKKVKKDSSAKELIRFDSLLTEVPEARDLLIDGRLARWDEYYLYNEFKKRVFGIDVSEVQDYFPTEETLKKMLQIYEELFSLSITEVPAQFPCYSKDLRVLEVRKKFNSNLEGVILLDLYPREGKGKHSAVSYYMTLGYSAPFGINRPSLDLVSCNFEKSGAMRFQDMVLFFHEFGHTIHSVLGRSEFLSLCGKKVKRDFVETPSVLLERWMRSPYILKRISSHVQTKQSLPDTLIDKIVKGIQLDEEIKMERFCFNNRLILELHEAKEDDHLDRIMQLVWDKELPRSFPGNTHFYSSWWHFSDGARTKYHMYLIAETELVPRLFCEIEKRGREKGLEPGKELVDPEIGAAYVDAILGKGGKQHPLEMVRRFCRD